jgi:hypothetical protein
MEKLQRHRKIYDTSRYGQPQIRTYHRKGIRKKSPRYLLKCGCCDQKIGIYYGDDSLEIGGVNGSIENWRDILLPMLLIESPKDIKKGQQRNIGKMCQQGARTDRRQGMKRKQQENDR